jgi:hypothetical protein
MFICTARPVTLGEDGQHCMASFLSYSDLAGFV